MYYNQRINAVNFNTTLNNKICANYNHQNLIYALSQKLREHIVPMFGPHRVQSIGTII